MMLRYSRAEKGGVVSKMAYVCTVCSSKEEDCRCPRFCMLCKSDIGVRLTEDGCYYCAECRDICGYSAEERFDR